MSNISTLRAAELSTLSNLAYANKVMAPVFGWTVLSPFSSLDASGMSVTTFRRGNDIVISFRGTDTLKDLVANSSFVLISWDKQFQDAVRLVSDVKNEYTDARIVVTGHSLGGGIAQIAAKMFNLPGSSFDAPGASAVTSTRGFLEAKAKYAVDVSDAQGSESFVNYLSHGSLISSVGKHVGQTEVLVPTGASFSSITIISFFALFAGGPITLLSLAGLFRRFRWFSSGRATSIS